MPSSATRFHRCLGAFLGSTTTASPRGHPLRPGRMLVGSIACSCGRPKALLLYFLRLVRHAGEQQFGGAPRRFTQHGEERGSLREPHVPAALLYGLNDL